MNPTQKARHYKAHLRDLSNVVTACLVSIDAAMKEPSTLERGQKIAAICNRLNMANDRARHFGLDMTFKAMKDSSPKP